LGSVSTAVGGAPSQPAAGSCAVACSAVAREKSGIAAAKLSSKMNFRMESPACGK